MPKHPGTPPSGRNRVAHLMLSIEDLQQAFVDAEPQLQAAFKRMRNPKDIMVLGDIDREEIGDMARQQLGGVEVGRIVAKARKAGKRPFAVMLQSRSFLSVMRSTGDATHLSTADELQGFADGPLDVIPVLVAWPGAMKAECWTPPGSNVIVHHC